MRQDRGATVGERASEYSFPCSSGLSRPIRLSEATRRFAYESLRHKYGLDTKKAPGVPLDGVAGFEDLSPLGQYDAAIREIAAKAPLRICEGELVSGAATLGLAIGHVVPATRNGQAVFPSVSHLTLGFGPVVRDGTNALRAKVLASLEKFRGTAREPFLKSCLNALDAMDVWRGRYIAALRAAGREENAAILERVPCKGAKTFREAVQSLWFTFAFARLCGNWPGIGRIDQILGPYLRRDLEAGAITLDEAREILAHFFIKGCEWVCGGNYGSGDAQHYQNIVLAGVDEDGRDVTNEVTYLVLDIIEETGISDFPTSIRVSADSDRELLRRAAEVVHLGGGVIAFYGEETVIRAMTDFGYPLADARAFANDGCWEVQAPGKTFFMYMPFDSLQILQKKTLDSYSGKVSFDTFESLYAAFRDDLRNAVDALGDALRKHFAGRDEATGEWLHRPDIPCTVVSLFEAGCIERALSYRECGPEYNVYSPHIGGLPDTVNSLLAIKKIVFDDRRVTFAELMDALRANWEGHEPLRLAAANSYAYYGNGSDEADGLWARILHDFSEDCFAQAGKQGYKTPGGVSTFGRQLEWAPARLATPFGRRAGEVLAANASPTPGTDREGATAIIRSYCAANLSRLTTGAALDLKLLPSSVEGEEGIDALVALIRGFVALGGFFMQPDVLDSSALRAAQERPEDYQTLSVRVSGWNARFVTLNREWQDMIIDQYERHS